jgi:hypothetical protein
VVASSALPLLVAGGWRLARAPRLELRYAAVFVVSLVVFSGSHNLTLAWGSVALIVTLLCLRVALGSRVAASSPRRLLGMTGLAVLALAVNAWFLVPDVLHGGGTEIATTHFPWSASSWINTPRVLFDPLRYVPRQSTAPALFVQAPVWFLLWALASAVLLRWSASRELRRAFVALAVVLLGFLALILVQPFYDFLPQILRAIQVPYRLNTFVAMAVAGLVLVAVLAVESGGAAGGTSLTRRLRIGLASAAAVSIGLCLWQLWVPATHGKASYANRGEALVSVHESPRSWYASGASYADFSAPVIDTDPGRFLVIDAARIESDHVTLTLTPPPGPAPFATNIIGGSYVVGIHGLIRMGRTSDGRVVMRRPNAGTGPIRLTIERSEATTAPWLVSLAAIATLLALLVCAAARRTTLKARAGSRIR